MGMTWTDDQRKVIELRDRNILVSAAAGSGKTAVLVERIIKIITDKEHPMDIDRLLIVTFTNAAAAEMRERIGNALENALKEQPDDEHLQRQLSLLHNAQITTIDSFCLYVIRNHFHEIDLEPNFRIGDEGELKLLKEDVLAKVLLKNYEESAPEFLAFVDGYASGRNDAALSGMILQLYEFSRSYPWPKKWLPAAAESYGIEDEASLESAAFMQSLLQNLKRVSEDLVVLSGRAYKLTQDDDGPDMYAKALEGDLEKYKEIAASESFADFYQNYRNLSYDRLASSRGFDGNEEKLELVKKLREMGKDAVKKINRQYFFNVKNIVNKLDMYIIIEFLAEEFLFKSRFQAQHIRRHRLFRFIFLSSVKTAQRIIRYGRYRFTSVTGNRITVHCDNVQLICRIVNIQLFVRCIDYFLLKYSIVSSAE